MLLYYHLVSVMTSLVGSYSTVLNSIISVPPPMGELGNKSKEKSHVHQIPENVIGYFLKNNQSSLKDLAIVRDITSVVDSPLKREWLLITFILTT